MFRRSVPCLIECDILRKKVGRVLSGSDLKIWPLQSIHELDQSPDEIGVVLLEGRLLSQEAFRKTLSDLWTTLPYLHAIVLIDGRESVSRLPSFPAGELCLVPMELPFLWKRIAWARFDAWKSRIIRKIWNLPGFPASLREALGAALNQSVPLGIEDREVLCTEKSVARRIGVRREVLSRAASTRGISFPSFLGACNALNALAEVKIESRSLLNVALCLGYANQSGFTKLMKRTMDMTPSDARARPLGESVRRWETRVLDPLLARGRRDEGHTQDN